MSLKTLLLSFSLLGLFITTGCTSAVKLGGVVVSIAEVSPGPQANTLQLKLLYKNENVLALAVSTTEHTVYLNGAKISSLESKIPVGLPPLASASQTLTFPAQNADALKNAGLTTATYRLNSVLILEAGEDDEVKIKTSSTGSVSLSALK